MWTGSCVNEILTGNIDKIICFLETSHHKVYDSTPPWMYVLLAIVGVVLVFFMLFKLKKAINNRNNTINNFMKLLWITSFILIWLGWILNMSLVVDLWISAVSWFLVSRWINLINQKKETEEKERFYYKNKSMYYILYKEHPVCIYKKELSILKECKNITIESLFDFPREEKWKIVWYYGSEKLEESETDPILWKTFISLRRKDMGKWFKKGETIIVTQTIHFKSEFFPTSKEEAKKYATKSLLPEQSKLWKEYICISWGQTRKDSSIKLYISEWKDEKIINFDENQTLMCYDEETWISETESVNRSIKKIKGKEIEEKEIIQKYVWENCNVIYWEFREIKQSLRCFLVFNFKE